MNRLRFLLWLSAGLVLILLLLGALSPHWLQQRLRLVRIVGIAYVAAIAGLTVYEVVRRLIA